MDKNRRKFLKIIFIGSGALLLEKVSSSLLPRFFNNSLTKTKSSNKTNLGGFRVAENNKRLSIYDSTGEEIFQIDKNQ